MTTLTPAKARTNLSGLLRKALRGADIGIVVDGHVVALRPVQVVAADYVESEYGLTPSQWRQTAAKLHEKAKRNLKAGKSRRFKGSIENLMDR
jgi:antitoxin (DNA-binding transcriptional repressor) of toxin-antitoxin stability system